MEDITVIVLAFDKNTKLIKASVSCDETDAYRHARYFRSIGYNARIVTYDMLPFYEQRNAEIRAEQSRLMREAGIYDKE